MCALSTCSRHSAFGTFIGEMGSDVFAEAEVLVQINIGKVSATRRKIIFMAGESRENEKRAESYPHMLGGGCPSH